MKDYEKLRLPLVTTQDEEYRILSDIVDLYLEQKAKTARKKVGDATEIVIRDHLLGHGLNMALNKELTPKELTVRGYENQADRIDAILLKEGINQHKLVYNPAEVDTIIEIKNTAASEQSSNIHKKFKALQKISLDLRFAVIVVSERLLSPTPYAHAIYEEDVNIEGCRVFTLVLRRNYLRLREKTVLLEAQEDGKLWKSNEWQDCINYLKAK